jgi:hypothetical protein
VAGAGAAEDWFDAAIAVNPKLASSVPTVVTTAFGLKMCIFCGLPET